jgi:hypothetical protein
MWRSVVAALLILIPTTGYSQQPPAGNAGLPPAGNAGLPLGGANVVPPPVAGPPRPIRPPRPTDPPAPAPQAYWYYCPSAEAYYPNAQACPEPWVKVPPRTE